MNQDSAKDVSDFINHQKSALRQRFRSTKARRDELQAELKRLEETLTQIKDRLKYTDELLRKCIDPEDSPDQLNIPTFGRYEKMGVKEAVQDYFSRHPDARMSIGDLTKSLLKEGLQTGASNIHATTFTTCSRLDGSFLQSEFQGKTKIFSLAEK